MVCAIMSAGSQVQVQMLMIANSQDALWMKTSAVKAVTLVMMAPCDTAVRVESVILMLWWIFKGRYHFGIRSAHLHFKSSLRRQYNWTNPRISALFVIALLPSEALEAQVNSSVAQEKELTLVFCLAGALKLLYWWLETMNSCGCARPLALSLRLHLLSLSFLSAKD